MRSFLTHLECTNCGATFDSGQLITVCPACGKVLFARYDLTGAASEMRLEALAGRRWEMWRYGEILPVGDVGRAVSLGEGGTPLIPARGLGESFALERVWIKEEGRNPTGSFKARGLAMAVARAKELGATTVAIPSAGNAAAAMAASAARAGLGAVVMMPVDTPEVMKAECRAYGATVILVEGLINDCGRLVREGAARFGWFDVSTLKEPYRAEGKKTMGLEIAEALGWRLPDAIVYPTGGGTGIVGMWKAFAELEEMGFIGSTRPKMVVVQGEQCAPIVRAFEAGERHAPLWEGAATVAPGMRVPIAIGDYLILDAVRASGGTAMTVSDGEMLEGVDLLARREGIYGSPEAGAAVVATRRLREDGWLGAEDEVVVFATGVGLKHTELVEGGYPVVGKGAGVEELAAAVG